MSVARRVPAFSPYANAQSLRRSVTPASPLLDDTFSTYEFSSFEIERTPSKSATPESEPLFDKEPLKISTTTEIRGNSKTMVRLPLRLPSKPIGFQSEVDLDGLILEKYVSVSAGVAIKKLKSIGAHLLRATTSVHLQPLTSSVLPSYIACSLSSSLPPSTPSHCLALTSPHSRQALLLPVHGLLLAAQSPLLSILSSSPALQKEHSCLPKGECPTSISGSQFYLPIVPLTLPSSSSFPLLLAFLYLSSPSLLLSSLLPSPSTTANSNTSTSTNTKKTSLHSLLNPTPSSISQDLSKQISKKVLLERIELVRGLWLNVVALRIGNSDLWDTMGLAWGILVGAVWMKEERRRKGEEEEEGIGASA